MLIRDQDQGVQRVDEFLSWLRGVLQDLGMRCPVLIVSGSIGLEPLVFRLNMPDRINYFYTYRLQPWNQATSIRCFDRLASSNGLLAEDGVGEAVYKALGIGIPHHVQSFFARLRDLAAIQQRERVTVEDVDTVYRTGLLGPSGQKDLVHYDSRLREALTDDDYEIAVRILAETAIQGVFSSQARSNLVRERDRLVKDARRRITGVLDVLEHDGYLVKDDHDYRYSFQLLKDWWALRFRGHYRPLDERGNGEEPKVAAQ